MESLWSLFLLFVAALTALITYMTIPKVPVAILTAAAAVVLAGGLWWHWTQFADDYRTSTWQEQLRNYASYVIVFVVILISYAFYVFAWSGGTLEQLASQTVASVKEAGRTVTATISQGVSRAATATSDTLFSEPSPKYNFTSASMSPNFLR